MYYLYGKYDTYQDQLTTTRNNRKYNKKTLSGVIIGDIIGRVEKR